MVYAAHRPLRRLWRLLHRRTVNSRGAPPNLGAHVGDSPCYFMHRRRELFELSHPQIPLSVLHADRLPRDLNNIKNANSNERLRLKEVCPPESEKIRVEDARRLLRLVRLESFKKRLQQIPEDYISHQQLMQFCMESVDMCSEEEAITFVKLLDESGHILVIDHAVHLRPYKVVKALEEVVPVSMKLKADSEFDSRWEELAKLKKEKAEIEQEAEKRVKAELRSGLGFVGLQTAVLMRFTFWELSWDVMEPICFFLTSIYFMAGYVFFLRTSTNPTFEGVFKSRIRARRKELMRKRNFDVERFRELRTLCVPKFHSIDAYNNH